MVLTFEQARELYKKGVFYWQYMRKYMTRDEFHTHLSSLYEETPGKQVLYEVIVEGSSCYAKIKTNIGTYTIKSKGRSISRNIKEAMVGKLRYHEFCFLMVTGKYSGEEYCLNY